MISLRRASPEDADQLTQITIAGKRHWSYPERWMQLWMPLLTISRGYVAQNETWVAVVEDRSVAYYSLKHDNQDMWLDNLWVLPDFMGQGLGSVLFNHALERCRAGGIVNLKIEADPHAQSFYEKMGARKTAERHTMVESQPRVLPIMEITL
jgi:GNAT superfamily N-acetyltransferase